MAEKRDYYELLGLSRSATDAEIKRAFRKQAKQYHPDANPGDTKAEEAFKEVSEAYEVLSNAQKRQAYDTFGHAGVTPGAGGGGFQGFGDLGDLFGFGSIFDEFFGRGGRRGGPRRGSDLQYNLKIEFEEAVFGGKKEITIPRVERCGECGGTGAKGKDSVHTCPVCQGTGQQNISQGFFSITRPCAQCGGRGKVVTEPCDECEGRGRIEKEHKLSISIPAGADLGTRLKLVGEGEAGFGGGPPGDLYVVIDVEPHELFSRDGDDVLLHQPISFVQAALGATIDIPTLYGKHKLSIAEGTQTGKVFKIRGAGIDNIRGYGRGDQLVQVSVVTPTNLTGDQKQCLRDFAEAGGDQVEPPKKGFFQRVREAFD